MLDLLPSIDELIDKNAVFWFCALAGSGMFVIQFVLRLFGADSPGDIEGGGEMEAGTFQWLSKQTLTGFLMMFGWVGLTCSKEFELPAALSVIIAFTGGLISMFITGALFKAASKLHSSGSVFNIEDTVGKEAMVYQRIPKGGVGKISLSLHQLTREIDAISLQGEEISSFTSVQIIKKADDNTVVVMPNK